MRYKCIKEKWLEEVDEGGLFIPGKYAVIPVGSIWKEDSAMNHMGGEVHLECESELDDLGWIEITRSSLEENFEVVEV